MSKIDEVRTKFGNTIASQLHEILGVILNKEGRDGVPASIHLCLNTALCAIVPAIPFMVKRQKMTKEEFEKDGPKTLLKLINYETVLFAALVTARMHAGSSPVSSRDMGDAKVIELKQDVEFGLQTLADAVEDWKKLTGKNPADYIDEGMLQAVEALQMEAAAPLDEFIKKRLEAQGPTPSSGTLQ